MTASSPDPSSTGRPPPRWVLKAMTRLHVLLHRLSGGGLNTLGGDEVCFVTMTGAKSGRALTIPLTVKFRAGVRDGEINYLDLGRICEDQGVAAVTLHPRTAKQFFRGNAEWDHIARLKEKLRIPVIGNGDVNAPEDAIEMIRRTGCDGVMIGRASMKNPWIFRQIEAMLRGDAPERPALSERRDLILDHFKLLRDREDEVVALHKIRTFTGWYTHGVPGGRQLRRRISEMQTVEEFLTAVEEAFASQRAA